MPFTVLSALCKWTDLIHTTTRSISYPHFKDEETERHREDKSNLLSVRHLEVPGPVFCFFCFFK